MVIKIYFVCILSALLFQTGIAQINIDSLTKIISTSNDTLELMKTYSDYGYQMYRSDADTAIYFANKALTIALNKNNDKEIGSNYNLLGLAYQTKGLYNLSLSYFDNAATIQKNDKLNLAKTLHNKALVYRSMNNNNEALKNDLAAMKIAEQQSDSVIIGVVYQTLCNIYRDLGDYALAETYILKSIRIFETPLKTGLDNRLSMLANAYSNYGNMLQAAGRLDEAIIQQRKAIDVHNTSGDLFNQGIAYENLGNIYLQLDQFDDALAQYEKAKEIMQRLNSATDVGYELMNIADVYLARGNYATAITNLDSALQIFTANKADSYRRDVYSKKYKIYDAQNNPTAALKFYKLFNNLNDSLNSESKKSELLRLKEEFESTQKEKEIAFLKTDNALKEKEKQLQIVFRNIAIAIILFILLIGFLLINRYRIKQQLKQLELRNKIASDLHDDIGSTLSSISMYCEIIKTQLHEKSPESTLLLEKMRTNSVEMIENMSDIVWALKPANDVFNKIENRMYNYATEVTTLHNIKLVMNRNAALENVKIPMEQRRDLYLIFKEVLNNSIKYSKCSTIIINFGIAPKILKMEIIDDGIGFDAAAQLQLNDNTTNLGGNGLKNIMLRAKRNAATLNFIPAPEKGTHVILEMPIA